MRRFALRRVLLPPVLEIREHGGKVGDIDITAADVAQIVAETVPNCKIEYAPGAGPDPRCYRVNCDKIAAQLPEFRPRWTVRTGIEELHDRFREFQVSRDEFLGNRYLRIKHIQELQKNGRLGSDLRWLQLVDAAAESGVAAVA